MELKKHEKLYSSENLVGYVRFSGGALEVHEDYIVVYKNFLPFSWNVYGRTMIMIHIEDIDLFEHRGCGWFPGHFRISFKHFKKPMLFLFGKWFVWRRKKLNRLMEPLFEFIANKVQIGWKKESYRKVASASDLIKMNVCPVCDKPLDAESKFCDSCGAKVKE